MLVSRVDDAAVRFYNGMDGACELVAAAAGDMYVSCPPDCRSVNRGNYGTQHSCCDAGYSTE